MRYKEAEHAVVCARCKARGSIAPDEEMAIRMWDERAGELKPDSWEKLEEDLDRCIKADSLCAYNPSEECSTCILPRDGQCNCDSLALTAIKERIRKLRGED